MLATELKAGCQLLLFINETSSKFSMRVCVCVSTECLVCLYTYVVHRFWRGLGPSTGEEGTVTHLSSSIVHTAWKFWTPSQLCVLPLLLLLFSC